MPSLLELAPTLVRKGAGLLYQRLFGRRHVRRVRSRPQAPYRGLVVGLERGLWAAFDAAYPEIDKVFAERSAGFKELLREVENGDTAILAHGAVGTRTSTALATVTDAPVFTIDLAPLPRIGGLRGFVVDSGGILQNRYRDSDVGVFLREFDLSRRGRLVDDARRLAGVLEIPLTTAAPRALIVPPPVTAGLETTPRREALMAEATALVGADGWDVFDAPFGRPWFSEDVSEAFARELMTHDPIITYDSPLGVAALAAGRDVIATGRPYYADWTVSAKGRTAARPVADFLAISVLTLARYVDSNGCLRDPLTAWNEAAR